MDKLFRTEFHYLESQFVISDFYVTP